METIIKGSEQRIKKNQKFKRIDENAHRLKKQRNQTSYSLNLNKYRQNQKRHKQEADKYKYVTKTSTGLGVSSLTSDVLEMEGDSAKVETRETWKNSQTEDIYLQEAVDVLEDLI